MIITTLTLLFIVHIVGCFWYTASEIDESGKNWITANHY